MQLKNWQYKIVKSDKGNGKHINSLIMDIKRLNLETAMGQLKKRAVRL